METKFYIKNRENRMETIFKKVTKWVALFLCVFLGSSEAFAQTLTVDNAVVCEGYPMVFHAEGFSENVKAITWYRKTSNEDEFIAQRTTLGNHGTFVDDMLGFSTVQYYVSAQGTNEKSQVITITLDKSEECANICRTTSTGDYYLGTDFNPSYGCSSADVNEWTYVDGKGYNCLEAFFEANDMRFYKGGSGYITDDWGYKPHLDDSLDVSRNNFYVVENFSSGALFITDLKKDVFNKKHYNIRTRMYLVMSTDCYFDGNAGFKLGTQNGSEETKDTMLISIHDDEDGSEVFSDQVNKNFVKVTLGSELNNYLLNAKQKGKSEVVFRFDIDYYGYINTPNSYTYLNYQMQLEQFSPKNNSNNANDVCNMKWAIDYISSQVESVCMDKGAVCVGKSTVVNAAGFSKSAVYHWEEYVDSTDTWRTLQINNIPMKGSEFNSVGIYVSDIGEKRYRVTDLSTKKGNVYETQIEFTITGKDCDPTPIQSIQMPGDTLCAPFQDTFSVFPVDANPLVSYMWELYTLSEDGVLDSVPGKILYKSSKDSKGDTVLVSLNADDPDGRYIIQAQPVIVRNNSGTSHEEFAGVPHQDTFFVYQKPVVRLSLEGFKEDDKQELCPNDDEQGIYAIVAPKEGYDLYDYIYSWNNAIPQSNGSNKADVVLPKDSACAGLLENYTITAKVAIKDFPQCYTVEPGTYGVGDTVSLKVQCNVLDQDTFYLNINEKFYPVKLPMPNYEVGCDHNPDLKVEVVTSPINKNVSSETFVYEAAKDEWNDFVVNLPAGEAIVSYMVFDGCGKSDTCSLPIAILDTFPPEIDCSLIPDYTTTVTLQNNCDAYPGRDELSFPIFNNPVLEDPIDGDITGKYVGRWFNPSQDPCESLSKFLTNFRDTPLDSAYKVGKTLIAWQFADPSGNVAYCCQEILVVDDSIPTLICPVSDLGDFVAQDGTCALSLDSLFLQLAPEQRPSAEDVCSGVSTSDASVAIDPVMYYKEATEDEYKYIPKEEYKSLIFKVGIKYNLRWRFHKKANSLVYVDCNQEFMVVDKEVPIFDCSALKNVSVMANYVGASNGENVYKAYASYYEDDILEGTTDRKYIPTLEQSFRDSIFFIPDSKNFHDNCSGDVKLKIEIYGPNENGDLVLKELKSDDPLEEMKNHLFYVGSTSIIFTFTDVAGNSSRCEQFVRVATDETPVTDCSNAKDFTIKVNSTCEASFEYALENVPKATVTYIPQGFYFNFRYEISRSTQNNIDDAEDVAKFFPDNLSSLTYTYQKSVPVPGGWPGMVTYQDVTLTSNDLVIDKFCGEDWNDDKKRNSRENRYSHYFKFGPGVNTDLHKDDYIMSTSNSLSTPIQVEVYPSLVRLISPDGQIIETIENEYDLSADTSRLYTIVPRRTRSNGTVSFPELAYICKYKVIQRTNFESLEKFSSKILKPGKYTLEWVFENEQDGNKVSTCETYINVIDTIAPTIDCGDWGRSETLKANADCVVEVKDVPWVKKLTNDDLEGMNVLDNCLTDLNLYQISWERRSISSSLVTNKDDAFTEPFPIGKTTITWYIADTFGNAAVCIQEINVADLTPPIPKCDELSPIPVSTSEDVCSAPAAEVLKAGLKTPVIYGDLNCATGTTNDIYAVGQRSDGLSLTVDPYPLGETVVTWTFTDAAGNDTTCEQLVVVSDLTPPKFDCEKIQDSVVYKLNSEECSASLDKVRLLLGNYQATDVCNNEPIIGVPFLDNNGALSKLPDEFERNQFYRIAWVFEDNAGNRTICYQTLEIRDVTAPNLEGNCPEPEKTIESSSECALPFSELGLVRTPLNDLCDGPIIPEIHALVTTPKGDTLRYYDNQVDTVHYPIGTHTFLWIYTDAAGNKDTCVMKMTILDKSKPILLDCDVKSNLSVTVSKDICEIYPEELKELLIHPKAYDQCDSLKGEGGIVFIDPIIERYFDEDSDGNFTDLEIIVDADGFPIVWDSRPFPKGQTMLRWIFKDDSGNEITCDKTITVVDNTPPTFDCASLDPDTIRPLALPDKCEVLFAEVDFGSYKAWDACSGDSIPGVITLNGAEALPGDDYVIKVGTTYEFLWVFADEDGNKTTCRQWVHPSHQLPVNFNCDSLKPIEVLAVEGTCEINAADVPIVTPFAIDTCTKDTFYALGLRSDSLSMEEPFPTGITIIKWKFVSPNNVFDTLTCEQTVLVKGNKKFELKCDEIVSTKLVTIENCGPSEELYANITIPMVPDPCYADSLRPGVPYRLDNEPFESSYPLGTTTIKWVFSDITNTVKDSCFQDVVVKTELNILFNCDSLKQDTIKVDAPVGACFVDASNIELGKQFALNPCTYDTIWGVPSRKGYTMDDPYRVGLNIVTWTFTDTTGTLIDSVSVCEQYVQVGDVNELPVDCNNFPVLDIVLQDDKCELSWADFNFEVKPVVDLCTKQIINPIVTIKSTGETIEYKTYFVLEDGTKVVTLQDGESAKDTVVELLSDGIKFGLGADTILWDYGFEQPCPQRISVKNKVAPSGGCESVPDELTIVAPSGECEIPTDALVDSLLNMLQPWPVAYDHCDVDKANPIKGKIYFDGKEITSDGSFSLPVGKNTVQWVFIDTAINTVGDTCDKTLIIQSDMAPIFKCKSLDTLNFETDTCKYTYEWNDENIPQAKDTCTGEFFAGVGTRSDNADLNAPYPMGKTVITWKFKSPYSTDSTICEQVVWVRTTAQPLFDCETLDTVQLFVLDGMCDEDVFTYLDTLTYPVAKDSCTGIEIPGIPLTKDSVEFSSESRFYVGDTTKIIWKFFHDSLNVTPKYCDQYVLVTSYNEPIFDCEALQEQNIKFEIAGCDTILGSDAIPTPAAVDYCTKDSVYGVGSRSDGKALNDPFPIGTTTITWLFKSPYSNISAECDQKVVVLSTQTIDFDCEDLDSIYVPIYDVNTCDTSGLILSTPVALHPCPEQSGIAEIKGVPFINKAVTITPNADSTEWIIDKIHVGLHKITWTFTDPSDPATLVDPVKECEQVLQIGDGTNASVDCKNYPDTTIVLDPTDCAISWEDMNLNIKPVFDVCSGELLVPALSRSTGKAIEATLNADGTLKIVAEDFTVGVDTIIWFFESIGAQCEQAILVKDNIAPEFDCENFEPNHLTLTAPSGECEVIASAIYDSLENLFEPWPFAIEKCTGDTIPGRVYLDEIAAGNELLKGSSKNITVGDHKLVWLFVDSLINQVGAVCEKDFALKSDMAPKFDCESLTDLKFDIEGCNTNSLTTDDIPTPQAKDACVDTLIAGVGVRLNADSTIQMDGTEPLPVLGVYPVGTTIIRWTFTSPFSNEEKVCYQNVVVKTTQEIDFDCESLEGEVIRISVNPLTLLSDPEDESSKIDTLHAIHPCPAESGVEFVLGVPSIEGQEAFILSSDSTKWTIPALPADTYKVVWTFADTTETMVEPIKRCEQTLIVENLKDTLFCPPGRNQSTITCVTEESLPIFNSFEEFKAAGGWITDHNQFDASSFGYIEDSIGTPYCDQTRYVTYFVLDVRGDKISCTDTIFVKDNEAPVFAEMVDTFTIACDEELPIFEKAQVDDCDPDVKLNLDSVSHQGDNPSECNYYSYTIDYQWTAIDRCSNKSVYPFVLSVVDTIAPTINLPLDWSDTALSNYLKGCLFSVPDFEEDLRSEEVIQDNCSSLDNIKISQYPAAGDTIKKTTTIYITISDPCGKDTVVTKVVYVQERDEILSLDAYDITKCGSDSSVIDLWGQTTRFATGFRYLEYGGTWYPVPSNPVYDCYRDSISEESLVFSDNPLTYYDKFHPGPSDTDKEIQRSLTELKRMSRSGKYIFVAVDTATMCRDTASSYLTINERPRVAIESGIMTICELTTVDSLDLYSYVKCVDDMGSEITNEGWTLGEDVYSFVDSVIMANNEDNLIYFVENACGKTTSEDTYITFCDSIPSTTEDSLKWVGGSEKNLAMLRSEDYKTKDSILLDVRKRFESEAIVINPTPNDPARIWKGEQVVLELNTDYKFDECLWYKVKGYFDYSSEVLKDSLEDEMDELLDIMEYSDFYELFENPEDTSVYYVTLTDGVCPAIPGQLLQVDVLPKLPTAFTPYDKDGMNDVYMEGRAVVIFDRYGAKVFEGDNGWDGTFKGRLADPGVYYSKVFLNSGMSLSGTIEIVKVK